MSDLDKRIGDNLKRLRGDKSQDDIALAMKERGFKWSQATVWNVERGERPLRLAEARVLVEVLFPERGGVFAISDLLYGDSAASLHQATSDYRAAVASFEAALDAALEAEEEVIVTAAQIKDSTEAEDWEDGLEWAFRRARFTLEDEGLFERFRLGVLARRVEDDHEGEGLSKGLKEEMVRLGADTLEELVQKRNEDAQRRGFENYAALREYWFTKPEDREDSPNAETD